MSVVQIWQDFAMCAVKFPNLIPLPVAAIQRDDVIALLLFERVGNDIRIAAERHYRLVEPCDLTIAEIQAYNSTPI